MSAVQSDRHHPSLQDVFVCFADTLSVCVLSLISQNLGPELLLFLLLFFD